MHEIEVTRRGLAAGLMLAILIIGAARCSSGSDECHGSTRVCIAKYSTNWKARAGRFGELPPPRIGSDHVASDRDRQYLTRLAYRLAGQPSAQSHADLAVIKLALGDESAAVKLLESAAERAAPSERPAIWSDLAAARLCLAGRPSGSPKDLVRALEAAEQAVENSPRLHEGLFNRALALEELTLVDQATVAWREYLQVDRTSGWRSEARVHLRSLGRGPAAAPSKVKFQLSALREAALGGRSVEVESIVGHARAAVRSAIERDLLPEWAAAVARDDGALARLDLKVLDVAARDLAKFGGDPLAAEAVAVIEHASMAGPRDIERVANAYGAYAQAAELAEAGLFQQALPRLERARRLLQRVGSPLSGWATWQVARCAYQAGRYERVRALLSHLVTGPEYHSYRALMGRSRHLLALVADLGGDPIEARRLAQEAVDDFGTIGELNGKARSLSLVVDADRLLGDQGSLWRDLMSSLLVSRESARSEPDESRFGPLARAAAAADEAGLPRAALRYHDEMVEGAQHRRKAAESCAALKERARLLGELGRQQAALRDLTEAARVAPAIGDPAMRRTSEEDVVAALGELQAARDPRQAVSNLDQAIAAARSTSYRYRLVTLLLARARAHRALSHLHAAGDDLEAALVEAAIERRNLPLQDAQGRAALSDRVRAVFQELVTLALERGESELALLYADQGRAEVLRDWLLRREGSSRSPSDRRAQARALRACVPGGTAAVEYFSMPHGIVAWVVRADRVAAVQIGAASEGVKSLARAMRAAAWEHRNADRDAAATRLYDLLVRRVMTHVEARDRLLLIVDGALESVAFPALLDRVTGHFLAAEHEIEMVPSLTLLAHLGTPRRSTPGAFDGTVLAVGDPRLRPGFFPDLPVLPDARAEARSVLAVFPKARLLLEDQATRAAFLDLAGRSSIVHFAGHAIADPGVPLLSRLLLAPGGAGLSGVLYARDLVGRRFEKTQLVVLAGCDTGQVALSDTEGVPALAWPFLAGGVRGVLVNLWSIHDGASRAFFADFYRRLGRMRDVPRALREAQAAAIATDVDSDAWRSLELFDLDNRAREPIPGGKEKTDGDR